MEHCPATCAQRELYASPSAGSWIELHPQRLELETEVAHRQSALEQVLHRQMNRPRSSRPSGACLEYELVQKVALSGRRAAALPGRSRKYSMAGQHLGREVAHAVVDVVLDVAPATWFPRHESCDCEWLSVAFARLRLTDGNM